MLRRQDEAQASPPARLGGKEMGANCFTGTRCRGARGEDVTDAKQIETSRRLRNRRLGGLCSTSTRSQRARRGRMDRAVCDEIFDDWEALCAPGWGANGQTRVVRLAARATAAAQLQGRSRAAATTRPGTRDVAGSHRRGDGRGRGELLHGAQGRVRDRRHVGHGGDARKRQPRRAHGRHLRAARAPAAGASPCPQRAVGQPDVPEPLPRRLQQAGWRWGVRGALEASSSWPT